MDANIRTFNYINSRIINLYENDIGVFNIWEDSKGEDLVDIEWTDGISTFNLKKVLGLLKRKGKVTKSELVDECLHWK